MKPESTVPYLQFSHVNLPQQLALSGVIAMFSEVLGEHARRMSNATLDGVPFPGTAPIYNALEEMIGTPYGLRIRLLEVIASEHDRKETYAPLAWHRIYLGCRVLWAMAAAPLGKPNILRENIELLENQSAEYPHQIIVVPRHLVSFPEGTDEDWITAASGPEPAVRLLPEMIPAYGA